MTHETNIEIIKSQCYKKNGGINGRCNEIAWWQKRNLLDLHTDITFYTNFLSAASAMNIRLFHYINKLPNIPICAHDNCSNVVRWHTSINTYAKFCCAGCNVDANKKIGSQNQFSRPEIQQKIKQTLIIKYGVDNFSKTAEFKAFMRNHHTSTSTLEKEKTQLKREKTNLELYGEITPLLNQSIKEKITETLMKNYGVSSPLKSLEILQKAKVAIREKYGRDSFQQLHLDEKFIENIKDANWISEQLTLKSLRELAHDNNISYSHLCKLVTAAGIDLRNYSYFEEEVYAFLRTITSTEILRSDKKILNGKEIDILLPELSIGIECNGIYWHSEISGSRDKKYHLEKTLKAEEKNIRLIHIFENEWIDQIDIVKNRLKQIICRDNPVVYARKCDIKQLSVQQEKQFLDSNHLQGYVRSNVCYGLFLADQLLMLMSFGKSRFSKSHDWELLRLASHENIRVIGGAKKLLSRFQKDCDFRALISYCDRRWFQGRVYKSLGFEFSHYSEPSYYYIESRIKLSSRMKYQKHKLKNLLEVFNPEMTEWQNMAANGYDRIWDCGNSVWIMIQK